MAKTEVYILKVQIANYPKESVAVRDSEWNTWYLGDKTYDTRGSIAEGEMCLLLNFLADKKFTSMLVKKEEDA